MKSRNHWKVVVLIVVSQEQKVFNKQQKQFKPEESHMKGAEAGPPLHTRK